jgi:hypothetical protein
MANRHTGTDIKLPIVPNIGSHLPTPRVATYSFSLFILFSIIKKDIKYSIKLALISILWVFLLPIYFYFKLGVSKTLYVLTGLGSINKAESLVGLSVSLFNLKIGVMLTYSILIIAFISLVLMIKNKAWIRMIPFLGISLPFILFYGWYLTKRGFFLGYFYEAFIAFIFLVPYALQFVLTKSFKILVLFLIVLTIISNCSLQIYKFPSRENLVNGGIDIAKIIGSGVKKNTVDEVSYYINKVTAPNDKILGSNLQWAVESERRQFLDLTHTLAYEEGTNVNELFNIHTRDEIKTKLIESSVKLIVYDNHFNLSFKFLNIVLEQYFVKCKVFDDKISIYIRSGLNPYQYECDV